MFHPPTNPPRQLADKIDRLTRAVALLRHRAEHVMKSLVKGPRGQLLTVDEVKLRADAMREMIEEEEAARSQRHRRVSLLMRLLTFAVVVVVDFPVMFWLSSSVFNVDWRGTLTDNYVPLALSFVVSVLATGGATLALHHIGHDQRENKDHDRHLDMTRLTVGSKVTVAAIAVLVLAIASTAFYRVWVEGELSGLNQLAFLLAALVAFVMLISAWLVFWTAFQDGSPEQNDLLYYSRLAQRHLRHKDALEAELQELETELEVLQRRFPGRAVGALPEQRRSGEQLHSSSSTQRDTEEQDARA